MQHGSACLTRILLVHPSMPCKYSLLLHTRTLEGLELWFYAGVRLVETIGNRSNKIHGYYIAALVQ